MNYYMRLSELPEQDACCNCQKHNGVLSKPSLPVLERSLLPICSHPAVTITSQTLLFGQGYLFLCQATD